MNKILCLLLTIVFLSSCSKSSKMEITVENPSNFDRTEEVLEISLDSIVDKVKLKDSLVYVVKNISGEIIPSQITYDRKLIFQPELKAGESKSFIITTDTAQTYAPKTYGCFISEPLNLLAWENERVTFCVYGSASIEEDGRSNGIDIWHKYIGNLTIDNWCKNGIDSSVVNHTEGSDFYKIGRSLGAGAMAPYVNNKLWLNDNFVEQEILDNGPLRTSFKLTYKNIEVDGKSIAENRTISLDAGSQLSKIIQAYTIKEPMQVAAGIVKREKNDSIISSGNYIIYAEPKSHAMDNIYLAMVFPNGIERTVVDTYNILNDKTKKEDTYSHVLGITTHQPKIPITYYTGYGWSEAGFASLADFEKYINGFSEGLKQPFIVKYK